MASASGLTTSFDSQPNFESNRYRSGQVARCHQNRAPGNIRDLSFAARLAVAVVTLA